MQEKNSYNFHEFLCNFLYIVTNFEGGKSGEKRPFCRFSEYIVSARRFNRIYCVRFWLTHDKDKTPDNRLFYRPFSPSLIEIR